MFVALAGVDVIYYYKCINIQFFYIYGFKNTKIKKIQAKAVTEKDSHFVS
jgi:hypothetical protein